MKGYTYTIVFTFLISAILTTVLAVANQYYQPKIQRNEEVAFKRAVLYVLDITPETEDQVETVFAQSIRAHSVDGAEVYVREGQDGQIQGYAVLMYGSGVWGSIQGYLGVSADRRVLLGIEFIAHSETPGLGGRIDESTYKEQFRGVPLLDRPISDGDVDGITGATGTSNAVLRIVNNTIDQLLPKLEVGL